MIQRLSLWVICMTLSMAGHALVFHYLPWVISTRGENISLIQEKQAKNGSFEMAFIAPPVKISDAAPSYEWNPISSPSPPLLEGTSLFLYRGASGSGLASFSRLTPVALSQQPKGSKETPSPSLPPPSSLSKKHHEKKKTQINKNSRDPTKISPPRSSSSPMARDTTADFMGNPTLTVVPFSTNQPPSYPESLRQEGVEDTVRLGLTLNDKGDVVHIKVLTPAAPFALIDAAQTAAKRWRFHIKNASRQEKKSILIEVPIVFTII